MNYLRSIVLFGVCFAISASGFAKQSIEDDIIKYLNNPVKPTSGQVRVEINPDAPVWYPFPRSFTDDYIYISTKGGSEKEALSLALLELAYEKEKVVNPEIASKRDNLLQGDSVFVQQRFDSLYVEGYITPLAPKLRFLRMVDVRLSQLPQKFYELYYVEERDTTIENILKVDLDLVNQKSFETWFNSFFHNLLEYLNDTNDIDTYTIRIDHASTRNDWFVLLRIPKKLLRK